MNIHLGYTKITLADYFLWIVYALCVCLYFYIVENIARDTKIAQWKIFDYILRIAYFLFVFILLTPLLIILNILLFKLYGIIRDQEYLSNPTTYAFITHIVTSLITSIISYFISSRFFKEKKRQAQEEIAEQEIKELDNATKLFDDGYFSHSVLESFKVLETHLYKRLTEKDVRVSRNRQNEIIQLALKYGIITDEDMPFVKDLKSMRNIAAHSDADYTKQQAEFALAFVRELLKRDESSEKKE